MCEHNEILTDGEYVCQYCGLVLEKDYGKNNINFFSDTRSNYNKDELYSNISNFLEILNLSSEIYTDEVRINLIKYLRNFKYNLELKIGATIFHVLSYHEIPYPINKIEKLVCINSIDKKNYLS